MVPKVIIFIYHYHFTFKIYITIQRMENVDKTKAKEQGTRIKNCDYGMCSRDYGIQISEQGIEDMLCYVKRSLPVLLQLSMSGSSAQPS